ncbi:hypothetical protein AHF37_06052, partial [Paragonimus kellicotti]
MVSELSQSAHPPILSVRHKPLRRRQTSNVVPQEHVLAKDWRRIALRWSRLKPAPNLSS